MISNIMDYEKTQYEGAQYPFLFVAPKEIDNLIVNYGITLPEKGSSEKIKKNVAKGVWNRDVLVDFCSEEVVKKCILICLSQYRTSDKNDEESALGLYSKILQIPYEQRFSENGIQLIYQTLVKWNMNTRGAKLEDENPFIESLYNNKTEIDKLSDYTVIDFYNAARIKEIYEIVENLFKSLNLTKTSKFVTVSKTLHFLHPQLMVPMDRTYTANYFHNFSFPDVPREDKDQAKWNMEFHKALCKVYHNHKDLFDKISFETRFPVTKLLDDILIGFQLYRRFYCNQFDVSYIMCDK